MHRIDIDLQPSRYFLIVALLAIAGSIAIVFALPLSILTKLFLLFGAIAYGARILWRDVLLKSEHSITGFSLNQEGWKIHFASRGNSLHSSSRSLSARSSQGHLDWIPRISRGTTWLGTKSQSSRNERAELGGESTVTAFVAVLRFKLTDSKRKLACVIFSDSLPPNQYRRLIVQLRTSHARIAEQARQVFPTA